MDDVAVAVLEEEELEDDVLVALGDDVELAVLEAVLEAVKIMQLAEADEAEYRKEYPAAHGETVERPVAIAKPSLPDAEGDASYTPPKVENEIRLTPSTSLTKELPPPPAAPLPPLELPPPPPPPKNPPPPPPPLLLYVVPEAPPLPQPAANAPYELPSTPIPPAPPSPPTETLVQPEPELPAALPPDPPVPGEDCEPPKPGLLATVP